MIETGHQVQLQYSPTVSQLPLGADGLEFQRLSRARKSIGSDRVRSRGGTFEQGAVRLVRHDRCALVNRCADATHVVPMMVHRDDVPNWLAGNRLLRLREHGECARL